MASSSVSSFRRAASIPKAATAYDRPISVEDLDELDPTVRSIADQAGFKAKVGQTLPLHDPDGAATEVLVGVGPSDALDAGVIRNAAAAYARAVVHHKAVALTMVDLVDGGIGAAVEGMGMASYRYRPSDSLPVQRVTVVIPGRGANPAFTQAVATVDAVRLVRDLVNEPGGSLTPDAFANRAKEVAAESGLKIAVWDERRIAREKLGGLLAVNQGSTHPPRFVTLTYTPKGRKAGTIALVGKGITFDSGGLSIKTGAGMMTMKCDMAGGASVLGAMSLLGVMGVKYEVKAYIPMTDNMINGDAFRPGDVFTARNGKTVEVLNTDAEGRLILGDALAVAAEGKPDVIINIATLTGAISAALGTGYAGVFSNRNWLVAPLLAAAGATGEKIWPMPLPTEYRPQLDSYVADLRNISSGMFGGALTAGLFLQEFVDDVPWAHIDLGMAAMAESEDGVWTKGATAFGMRLLAALIRSWDGVGEGDDPVTLT